MLLESPNRASLRRLLKCVPWVIGISWVWLRVSPAFAGFALSNPVSYPANVNVGQMHVLVSMIITNNSADDPGSPGVDSEKSVTVENAFHTPACDIVNGSGTCPAGSREPGVFAIDGTVVPTGAAGEGQSGCSGTWTIGAPDPLTGDVSMTPPGGAGTLILGPSKNGLGSPAEQLARRCTITFGVNVLMLPNADADTGTPGIQTDQLARVTGHFSDTLVTGTGTGADVTTIVPPTPTTTPTITPSPTCIPGSNNSVTGHIRYYSNGSPVSGATVLLRGPVATSTQTDAAGQFAFTSLDGCNFHVEPQKLGGANNGISALDAAYSLQWVVSLRSLDAQQRLACDVTGNGTVSALDASLILQLKVGLINRFPVAQACTSDWAFLPVPAAAANQQVVQPANMQAADSCRGGAIEFTPLAGQVDSQDFSAVLFGDCTGNWQP